MDECNFGLVTIHGSVVCVKIGPTQYEFHDLKSRGQRGEFLKWGVFENYIYIYTHTHARAHAC